MPDAYLRPLADLKLVVTRSVLGLRLPTKAHFDLPQSVSPEWL